MLSLAVKEGGSQPDNNPKLRIAIEKAREVNMPRENIERAIGRGADGSSAETLEHIFIDAFGPGGTPLLIELISDNRNRILSSVRALLNRYGGKIGGEGTARWFFEPIVIVCVEILKNKEDTLLQCIEHGARDIENTSSCIQLTIDPDRLNDFLSFCKASPDINQMSLLYTYLPKQQIALSTDDAQTLKGLISQLKEEEDVQDVYAAANIA